MATTAALTAALTAVLHAESRLVYAMTHADVRRSVQEFGESGAPRLAASATALAKKLLASQCGGDQADFARSVEIAFGFDADVLTARASRSLRPRIAGLVSQAVRRGGTRTIDAAVTYISLEPLLSAAQASADAHGVWVRSCRSRLASRSTTQLSRGCRRLRSLLTSSAAA